MMEEEDEEEDEEKNKVGSSTLSRRIQDTGYRILYLTLPHKQSPGKESHLKN